MALLLLLALALLAVAALPVWPHSRRWSYGPSGGLVLVLLIVVALLVMGRF